MKEAIADSLTGVSAGQVTVRSVACTAGSRRLHGLVDSDHSRSQAARRLAGSLTVHYEVNVPRGVTAPTQGDLSTMTLKTNVNSRLLQQGVTGGTTSFMDSARSGARKGTTNASITGVLGLLAATL